MKKTSGFFLVASIFAITAVWFAGVNVFGLGGGEDKNIGQKIQENAGSESDFFAIVRVIDGDTFEVNINGALEKVRLIGVDTPEVVDPRKPVECFGIEASNRAKEILMGKKVRLESDPTQGDCDKYGRLLRYAFLEDGANFNLLMIKEGYAHEYTYAIPYQYQQEFKAAQTRARQDSLGLWGDVCQDYIAAPAEERGSNGCSIKGNINAQGEKIYHIAGCGYYRQTVIDEAAGERWFCSEQEALDFGWRKALNCP